ncbi:ABC transporter related [Desulfatibacillum aliphaticivorans]|uniref:ABC transporter related n=1 Tax=Desulfatibacillum aliphaticivorans TaxID=218208 RepID=B8FLS0_DESAL|nr:ABC transporter ATP-binding protein [Desulfatibacillum aliphaticivorans]ACL05424.1 ABC transporter related [Desulfatibacillum aliphaticivorans]
MTTQLKLIPGHKKELQATPVLQVSKLSKVFKTGDGPMTVLQDVNFQVAEGEFLCVLGPSGCGKTTLLNVLAGFEKPSAGNALLEETPITESGPDRCVVFQEDTLFPWLTVKENIAFGVKGLSKKEKREKTNHFLDLVGLTPFGDYLPREISGGMKKRVSLARVLILQPRILLMDEPFGALDAQTREEMQDLLLSLWNQFHHTIIFITHDIDEAVALADRILVMQKDPGMIAKEIRVRLPRPRERTEAPFQDYCKTLYQSLKKPQP